jgi:hypothetical protein
MSTLTLVHIAECATKFAERITDEFVHGLEPLFIQSSKRKAKMSPAEQHEEVSAQADKQAIEQPTSHDGFGIKM